MKHVLNTLYITTPRAYLSKEGETVLIHIDDEIKKRIPIHTLGSIVCFGATGCSPYLMEMCSDRGVGISFLSDSGKFLARVVGATTGNILLRRKQYELSGDEHTSVSIARSVVLGKLVNLRSMIQRANRDRATDDSHNEITEAIEKLRWSILQLERVKTLDEIRGVEGDASRAYFSVFDYFLTANKESFFFRGRSRRPPRDNVNCMLSFTYTLLLHDCRSALESVGIDPQAGFLHRDRPGRPSMALDLMEEFRGPIADRLVSTLINRQQVKPDDFTQSIAGAVTMSDNARKTLIVEYQQRKQDEIQHPFLGDKMKIGLLTHVQAQLLAKHIRGELDSYPPFVWK